MCLYSFKLDCWNLQCRMLLQPWKVIFLNKEIIISRYFFFIFLCFFNGWIVLPNLFLFSFVCICLLVQQVHQIFGAFWCFWWDAGKIGVWQKMEKGTKEEHDTSPGHVSCFEYCNALLTGLPACTVKCL